MRVICLSSALPETFRFVNTDALAHSISLLTDFQDVPSYLDWTVGVHGIYISFPHPSTLPSLDSSETTPSSSTSNVNLPFGLRKSRPVGKPLTATYLPDVAPAQGWTKVEAIDSAIRKAGWDGRITEQIRRSVKLRTYKSSKTEVTWHEYWAWRLRKLEEQAAD